jgi:flagellar protein FlaJ
MPYTAEEYVSMAITVGIVCFAVSIPMLSLVISVAVSDFFFGFMMGIFASMMLAAALFYATMKYPALKIQSKGKDIDNSLPFAAMYLSTIAGSKLPLHKTFEVFSRFMKYGEIVKQINLINEDVRIFGLDVVTALERAIERSPSKNFREMLYGMLATIRSGANMNIYLKQRSNGLMADYRRKLYEFSHALTVYVEIYLTAIVLGAIFFTVLTAIISGISGTGENIVTLQFFLIFLFMPMISMMFIYLVKSATPGGE